MGINEATMPKSTILVLSLVWRQRNYDLSAMAWREWIPKFPIGYGRSSYRFNSRTNR